MNDFSTWSLWQDRARGAAENMAVDEALLLSVDKPLLRLYQWNKPALTIGICQHYDKVKIDGVEIARRITGGGVVDHRNSFTYTLVIPSEHPLAKQDTLDVYRAINETVEAAIAEMGVDSALTDEEIKPEVDRRVMACAAHPTKYDIVKGSQKISGCAQRRMNHAVLHQGYIDERVGDWERLKNLLVKYFRELFSTEPDSFQETGEFSELVERLVVDKYNNEKWNRRR